MIHTNDQGPEYTPEEWNELQLEIERSGGAILPDACLGEPITIKAAKGGTKGTTTTCFCGNQSMAVITYDPVFSDTIPKGGGFARVCLVCDVVGQWPRFSSAINEVVDDD